MSAPQTLQPTPIGYSRNYQQTIPYPVPLSSNHNGAGAMQYSNGKYDRRVHGDSRDSCSLKKANGDWLADKLQRYAAAELVHRTGMTPKAAENLRAKRNKINFDNLVELCRNDPLFRAEFFQYCGGHLETSPEFYAGVSRAFAAWQVKTQQGAAE